MRNEGNDILLVTLFTYAVVVRGFSKRIIGQSTIEFKLSREKDDHRKKSIRSEFF